MKHHDTRRKPSGIFVGLSTVDLQYGVEAFPAPNTKRNASQFVLQPGGPAYNASVVYSVLGGNAIAITAIGRHALGRLIVADGERYNVRLVDIMPGADMLPISSIIVEMRNGNRTVISNNYAVSGASADAAAWPADSDVVLCDGFYPEVASVVVPSAKEAGAAMVYDGGSWKEGISKILPLVDVAICSERFHPPGATDTPEAVMEYLVEAGVRKAAITRGGRSIIYLDEGAIGEVFPPQEPVAVFLAEAA